GMADIGGLTAQFALHQLEKLVLFVVSDDVKDAVLNSDLAGTASQVVSNCLSHLGFGFQRYSWAHCFPPVHSGLNIENITISDFGIPPPGNVKGGCQSATRCVPEKQGIRSALPCVSTAAQRSSPRSESHAGGSGKKAEPPAVL